MKLLTCFFRRYEEVERGVGRRGRNIERGAVLSTLGLRLLRRRLGVHQLELAEAAALMRTGGGGAGQGGGANRGVCKFSGTRTGTSTILLVSWYQYHTYVWSCVRGQPRLASKHVDVKPTSGQPRAQST